MSRVLKATTGLTGLAVAQNPHHTLGILYGKILRTLQKLPQDAAYRNYTEEVVKQRVDVLKQNESVKDIETKIGCGQVEELILQAENELILARKMLNWKPWLASDRQAPANQWSWPPSKLSK